MSIEQTIVLERKVKELETTVRFMKAQIKELRVKTGVERSSEAPTVPMREQPVTPISQVPQVPVVPVVQVQPPAPVVNAGATAESEVTGGKTNPPNNDPGPAGGVPQVEAGPSNTEVAGPTGEGSPAGPNG
ncbi:MAG: hypothetical protein IH951_11820 [Bacteroidetes bacterium]|nr:hypothetical protein [Bacteroidota bacterium]